MGLMSLSRVGTRSRSSSTPRPDLKASSERLLVSPAAPMSWTPSTRSFSMASRVASMRSFPKKGSPTWTAGRSSSLSSESSRLAKAAPPIPSLPVLAPA